MGGKLHKVILSGIGLLLSVVLLAGGTYAWYAISTNPEVRGITVTIRSSSEFVPFEMSISEDGPFTTQLDISQLLDEADVLRPISTYDGVHWYLPLTDAFGNVSSLSMISEGAFSSYANTGNVDTNYVAYIDLYIRSSNTSADAFSFRLSNPTSDAWIQDSETDYGTYVLYDPSDENDALAAFRMGFQFYDYDGNVEDCFYIYEPNAKTRSDELAEFDEDSSNATASYLYEELTESSDTNTNASNYTTKYADDTYYWTVTAKYSEEEALGFEMVEVGNVLDDESVVLIRQNESTWSSGVPTDGTHDSTDIATIGDFMEDPPSMTTIEVGDEDEETVKVKKVRIYFWIEGQDIDCWNHIVAGNIFANLEFTGDAVEIEEVEEVELEEIELEEIGE